MRFSLFWTYVNEKYIVIKALKGQKKERKKKTKKKRKKKKDRKGK